MLALDCEYAHIAIVEPHKEGLEGRTGFRNLLVCYVAKKICAPLNRYGKRGVSVAWKGNPIPPFVGGVALACTFLVIRIAGGFTGEDGPGYS